MAKKQTTAKASVSLTEAQHDQIISDLDGMDFLTNTEVQRICDVLNTKIELPINEEKQVVVLSKIIRIIDRALYQFIPNEIYSFIRSEEEGVNPNEARLIKSRVYKIITETTVFPFLNEFQEERINRLILNYIVSAMTKGNKL